MADNNLNLDESPLTDQPVIERNIESAIAPHEQLLNGNGNGIPNASKSNQRSAPKKGILDHVTSIGKKKGSFNGGQARQAGRPPKSQNIGSGQAQSNRPQSGYSEPMQSAPMQEQQSYAQPQQDYSQFNDNVPPMSFSSEPEWVQDAQTTGAEEYRELPKEGFGKSVNATAELIVSILEKVIPEGAALISQINEEEASQLEREGEIVEGSYDAIVDRNLDQKKDYQIDKDSANQIKDTLTELLNAKGAEMSPEARLVLLLLLVIVPIGWAAWQNRKRNKVFLEELMNKTREELSGFQKKVTADMTAQREQYMQDFANYQEQFEKKMREREAYILKKEKELDEKIKNSRSTSQEEQVPHAEVLN